MRTTLTIDGDVLEAARRIARTEGQTLGTVICALARRGLAPGAGSRSRTGFPVFDVPQGAASITLPMVRDALEGEHPSSRH